MQPIAELSGLRLFSVPKWTQQSCGLRLSRYVSLESSWNTEADSGADLKADPEKALGLWGQIRVHAWVTRSQKQFCLLSPSPYSVTDANALLRQSYFYHLKQTPLGGDKLRDPKSTITNRYRWRMGSFSKQPATLETQAQTSFGTL